MTKAEKENNNEFQLEMDKIMTEIVHNLPNNLIEYVKEKVLKTQSLFLKNNSFQLELIADTNIIFSEVRSLMLNHSSFFLKIADNPYIKIYAPKSLKIELYEKIRKKFPKDKKTRDLDIEECLTKADTILSKIEVREDISQIAINKASLMLNERDPKDILFVALNISLNTHGVLTNDKDIKELKEVKTWKLADAGRVITEVNKGSMSFVIINETSTLILDTIINIIKVVWSGIILIVNGLIKLFNSILKGSIEAIFKIPQEIQVVLGFTIISILLIDDLRNDVGEFISMLWAEIKKIIVIIKNFFKVIIEVFQEIFEAIKPILNISLETYKYFLIQSNKAMLELEELELKRAN